METYLWKQYNKTIISSYRTYEEWKQVFQRESHLATAFLPYLWGMETFFIPFLESYPEGSYRTYEEWKQWKEKGLGTTEKSSYRTYEEWKRMTWTMETKLRVRFLPYLWGMETRNDNDKPKHTISSYRTYEEWKQFHDTWVRCSSLVLTVPMRNGNRVVSTF